MNCPNCHNELPPEYRLVKPTRYRLTPGLVHVLRKLAVAIGKTGRNDIHLDDASLTYNEQSQTTKLRFFGLIAKVERNGKHVSKRWLLTRRGWRFLNCLEAAPAWVLVRSNRLIEPRATESLLISRFPVKEPPYNTPAFEIVNGDVFVPANRQAVLTF